jgi:hypothetical protein
MPVNDPALQQDLRQLRWSLNNYFNGHMRNLGLMAMALDEGDDPGGELRGFLRSATGHWLYLSDSALRSQAAGGLSPEGTLYAGESLAYMTQFLFALHTAGEADPARWGPQVVLSDNPFWTDFVPAIMHTFSPIPVEAAGDLEGMGQIYLPAPTATSSRSPRRISSTRSPRSCPMPPTGATRRPSTHCAGTRSTCRRAAPKGSPDASATPTSCGRRSSTS